MSFRTGGWLNRCYSPPHHNHAWAHMMSEFESHAAPPPPPVGTSTPSEERTLALAAHLLGIVSCFIGALVIWLISKDASPSQPFATDQAKEALNFQITVTLAMIAAVILAVVTLGALAFLLTLVWIASQVFCIVAAVKANNGEYYRYPFALRLIK
ncbi:DUF4870 domain-containing protein [Xanthomonas oryzae pv. oryzae]|uniref:DUF4870 domain-containing protein n=1 Tax=Xanthomonas oryzae pv. oryzae TaxID=64187 RepID=A0A854CIK9_XANOO|nr:DUF4870 domain-containing protein [Xanthomonas oryzae]ALZ74023.1 hypothetical protein APZ20_06860 [Xanthomonas oryzae pv. oryzae]AOS04686.1 hypothetical protein ATY42_16105 [Xanthomonas oryzae pv. oryzae]AOS08746.1 hypothetical protein ATY43_12410 [Xanthomonas oryzae pv. oryzae]AOS12839.1 hypothetical protein ATY44_06910 [Xanthomonas oryzae pv. oryzae]AOS17006.1 hypothetical protein ATY45_06700 [Xanthomonas oryzae pv. oryzae]